MKKGASTAKPRRALLAVPVLAVFSVVACGVESVPAPRATHGASKGKRYPVRGIYDRDIDRQVAIGFNFIDTGPGRDQVRAIAARGLKPLVWLGGYSNSTCTFNESDDWIRSHVRPIAAPRRHARRPGRRRRRKPLVGAYYIDDEPNAAECPTAPAQMRTRSRLVKSIDPRPPTLVVTNKDEQLKLFAGTADVIGLDHYPCSIKNGCDYSKIDRQAAKADRLGIRYWGIIQAYGDGASASCGSSPWYRLPTADELHEEFVHWRATNMEGYLVFAWRWPDCDSSVWLANHPELQHQLAVENAR